MSMLGHFSGNVTPTQFSQLAARSLMKTLHDKCDFPQEMVLNIRNKKSCSSWAPLPWPLTCREGNLHCSLELCCLWLSVVNGQLVFGLQVIGRKAGVAAREVTAELLIHSECQKYLLASSCLLFYTYSWLFIAVSESVSEHLL